MQTCMCVSTYKKEAGILKREGYIYFINPVHSVPTMFFNGYQYAVMKVEKDALWKTWQIVNSGGQAGTQVSAVCTNQLHDIV